VHDGGATDGRPARDHRDLPGEVDGLPLETDEYAVLVQRMKRGYDARSPALLPLTSREPRRIGLEQVGELVEVSGVVQDREQDGEVLRCVREVEDARSVPAVERHVFTDPTIVGRLAVTPVARTTVIERAPQARRWRRRDTARCASRPSGPVRA
jgi:hypothetical protein